MAELNADSPSADGILSIRCFPFVSGRMRDAKPPTTATIPNVQRGMYGLKELYKTSHTFCLPRDTGVDLSKILGETKLLGLKMTITDENINYWRHAPPLPQVYAYGYDMQ